MIKADIAKIIEKNSEFNRSDSLLIVKTIIRFLRDALAKGEKIEIRGFGSFRVVPKKTGYGRDIRRNIQIEIKKGKRVKFRPGQDLKKI
jgi:nucleoid DNA-binding protein